MALFVGAERMRTDENDMWLKEGEISEVFVERGKGCSRCP